MVLIGINSNIPRPRSSPIRSRSAARPRRCSCRRPTAGWTWSRFAGASVMNPISNGNITAFVRNGIIIREPKDFIGKKVGAHRPPARSCMSLFVKWLVEKGVDPRSVNFVEVTFPTMFDIMKSGASTAVLTAEPFVTRMTNAGFGGRKLPASRSNSRGPIPSFSTLPRAKWADKIPDAIKKLRDAITEAARIVNNDREKASASIQNSPSSPSNWSRLPHRTAPNRS